MSEEKEILIGLTGIASRFRVSRETVRRWYARGAPIIRLGGRSYRAVFDDVVAWLKRESIR